MYININKFNTISLIYGDWRKPSANCRREVAFWSLLRVAVCCLGHLKWRCRERYIQRPPAGRSKYTETLGGRTREGEKVTGKS